MAHKRYSHAVIARRAARHGAAYLTKLEPAIVSRDERGVVIDTDHPAMAELLAIYGPTIRAAPTSAIRPWPRWARLLRCRRRPEDRGVGDVAHRWAQRIGADRVASWLKSQGWDCGCTDRQAALNAAYPFEPAS